MQEKEEVMKNREGYIVTVETRECTKCGSIFPNKSRTVTLCPTCNSSRVKGESQEVRMYRRAKARSTIRGVEFSIDKSDVVIPKTCPILGINLQHKIGSSGGSDNSPALDRIDNDKGYIKGNVQVISHLANMMKSSASVEHLQKFAAWVNSTFPVSIND